MLLSTLFIFSKVVRFGTIYIICHIITGLIFCISYSRFPDLPRWSWILSSCNALKKRDELVSLIDKLEQEKASIDQKIQMELQDAGYWTAGDYRVSWLNTVSKRLDTKLFKAENPEMYDKYAKESSSRRFIVKHIAAWSGLLKQCFCVKI